MQAQLPLTDLVAALPATVPFKGPEAIERERGRAFRVRLGANESAFGIAPAARAAMIEAVGRVSWYGDPDGQELRAALAARHGVTSAEICLGAGIDELLGLLVRATVAAGTPVVTSHGGYPTFNFHVHGFGGRLEAVPYRDDHNDLEALAAAVRRVRAPLVYLANPDNPTGTWHERAALEAFMTALPPRCLLILDEAYIDFAPGAAYVPVSTADPRVVRMRTFSKAHGMAGARIGYAIAAREVVSALDRIRNHFGVNRIAQAGALASLREQDFVAGVVQAVAAGRAHYAALADRLGLATLPSATNFVAMDAGSGARARCLLERLETHGVFVRRPAVAPLDRCIRVTVGTPAERACFAERLAVALAQIDAR